jgi:cytochrome b561
MPLLLRAAAQLAHLALYAMLLTLPILGLAVCNAHGVDVSVFGLFQLPSLVAADPDLADELTDYHVWAAWGLLALVSAHVVAALWHHAVRRDGVLVAMLPALKRR